MDQRSLVSVIIPVYNCEAYLAEAIDSVLAQAYAPLEVIVVDDGSTDGSIHVAARYAPRVRCVHQENSGIGAARNRGIEQAAGDMLAFLDADDLWSPTKLSLQVAALDLDPEMDIVLGLARQFRSPDMEDETVAPRAAAETVMAGYVPGTVLIRRESFARVGPFATGWRVGEFIDWYARAVDLGLKSHMLQEVVLHRRLHDTNIGIVEPEARADYLRILKASLDRRRGGRGTA
jgi:glycosyltransferase involved in cell wall biosynthesis